jgi:hypothetical protein
VPPSTTAAIEGLKLLGSPPNVQIKISALTAYDSRPDLKACARSR